MTVPGTGVAAVPCTEYSYTSPYTQYSTTPYGVYGGYTSSSIVDRQLKLNSVAQQPLRAKRTVPISAFMTLGTEVHEQMFRSGDQSDMKPPVFSSQASRVLICLSRSCLVRGKIPQRDDRWRHHLSPPPQFRHGTEGEGNILQSPALVIQPTRLFRPTDLTSTYSVCTWRVFDGIGHQTQAFQSGVRYSNH
ncbi:hypothetical protein TNCV_2632541 [Trichonephila clavipes]|nr:hypothetical protein TNCV_2632541 [Trichonephila clavipes]